MKKLLSRIVITAIASMTLVLSFYGLSLGQEEAQASGSKLQNKPASAPTKIKEGPDGCYEVWKNPDGTLDVRLNCLNKGDYQASAQKFERCRLAWLEDYEKNYKPDFFIKKESVLGFKKSDPVEYREKPLIRLTPRPKDAVQVLPDPILKKHLEKGPPTESTVR